MATHEPILHLTLDQLQVIDTHSVRVAAPPPGNSAFSVALWFQTATMHGKRVLASQGDDSAAGWQFFLDAQTLTFRVQADDDTVAEVSATLRADAGGWTYVAAVLDRGTGQLRLYASGARAAAALPDGFGAVTPDGPLVVGGYTDPAGGHFDHTFGRNGTGWIDDVRVYAAALADNAVAAFAQRNAMPLRAVFTVDAEASDAPALVRFDGSGSDGGRAWLWDFGDGARGYGPQVEHRYAYAGDYAVRLTVVGGDHRSAQAEQTVTLAGQPNPLRPVAVFANGQDGYACFRIPAIVRATNGDLLAFAEGRVESCSDSTHTVRAVLRRSRDNGQTWTPLQVIGRHVVDGDERAAQNVSPVVEATTRRVIVLYNGLAGSEWELARGEGRSHIYQVTSDDHGVTWSAPVDVSAQVHRPEPPDRWQVQRPTLGHAIQLRHPARSGRLLHAGMFSYADKSVFASRNYLFWSDDGGANWQIGGVVPRDGLNEATLVELENGDVLINSRAYDDERPAGRRAVTTAHFDGDDVRFEPTQLDPALVDSAVQASTLRLSWADEGASRILFANPAHPQARLGLTVRMSTDDGQTWPVARVVDPGPSAYSDMVVQADGRVGVLYERGNQGGIVYVSLPVAWLEV